MRLHARLRHPGNPRIIRHVDHLEYLAQENARRDANRMLLGIMSFVFFGASVGFFAAAAQETETESSGHLWWKDETTVAIPTETRVAWLLGAMLLMSVAFTLALITYRVSIGRRASEDGDQFPVIASTQGRSPHIASGHSKEFWIQTTIAVLGLIITAVSAAAAWWA